MDILPSATRWRSQLQIGGAGRLLRVIALGFVSTRAGEPRSTASFTLRSVALFRRIVACSMLGGLAPIHGVAKDWTEWLNPEIRLLEARRVQAAQELEKLGEPSIGQTVDQYGYQHPLSSDPPAMPAWVQIDLVEKQTIDCIVLIPAQANWRSYSRDAYGFPVRFQVDVSDGRDFERRIPFADFTDADYPDPGAAPVVLYARRPVAARYIRVTVTKMPRENDRFFYALAEVMVLSGNLNIAINRPVEASVTANSFPWKLNHLVDSRTPLGPPIVPEFVSRDGFFIRTDEGVTPEIILDLGRVYAVQEIRLHPVHARRRVDAPGASFPVALRLSVAREADFSDATVLYKNDRFSNPGNNPMTRSGRDIPARYVRIEATPAKIGGPVGFSEIEVYAENRNVARNAKITATPDRAGLPERWPESLLQDGFTSYGRLLELPKWFRGWERRRELKAELAWSEQRMEIAAEVAHERAFWLAAWGGVLGLVTVGGLLTASRHRRKRELDALRARLARDLHDEIGSNLASLTMMSEAAEAKRASPADREEWIEVRHVVHETTGAMHEVLWLIGGREEPNIDLEAHLKLAASRILGSREVQWHGSLDALPPEWPGESKRQVFLFFKEALANIMRHSRASRVEFSLQIAEGRLRIGISDNGVGFAREHIRVGVGLESQRLRAHAVGGTFAVDSAPGVGTTVSLVVPLHASSRRRWYHALFRRTGE